MTTVRLTQHDRDDVGEGSVTYISRRDLSALLRTGGLLAHVARYNDAIIETDDVRFPRAPFLAPLAMRALAPRSVFYVDDDLHTSAVTWPDHFRSAGFFLRDLASVPAAKRRLSSQVAALARAAGAPARRLNRQNAAPWYVRTDLVFRLRAGGSVGHTAGVVNSLGAFGPDPFMLTPASVPTVDERISVQFTLPENRYRDFRRLPHHWFNVTHQRALSRFAAEKPPSWLYHRYCLGSFSAAAVALKLRVPLVLEYNGSEVWAADNWGEGGTDTFDSRVEEVMVRAADLVVVVSKPLAEHLSDRGVEAERILVNPNGVDVDRYHPDLDGREVRDRLGIGARPLIGFIGTFGRWHGADILAKSFVTIQESRPDLDVHLLLVGDGLEAAAVRNFLTAHARPSTWTMTGIVPQDEAPGHLAACDVLAAPHVPNFDGSPFFGSPTKLFEYMAMGRGIVASSLDQIADVLDDGVTALLVEPGSIPALATAITTLLDDRNLASRLGAAARACATKRHTWVAHTRRIVEKLQERCG